MAEKIPVSNDKPEEMKIQLQYDGVTRGGVFLPVIEYCLENGCEFSDRFATLKQPFSSDQSGVEWCSIVGPIAVKDVLDNFVFPKNITSGETSFWDPKSTVELRFISRKKFEEAIRKSAKRKEMREKKRAARKEK